MTATPRPRRQPSMLPALSVPRPNDPLSTSKQPPPPFAFRRAATIGQPPQLRRRLNGFHPPSSAENQNAFANLRRRSSTYSDYLETSADELLNPSKSNAEEDQKSMFVYIPLTLALLPAIAGLFFENGSAFFTDLILLTLAAVFLHWSVTQPWDWYHSAQQVRVIQDEVLSESVFESESDLESPSPSAAVTLDDVPEEKGKEKEEAEVKIELPPRDRNAKWEARQRAAVNELYIHEIVALAWCFVFPMLGAYLLHTIRGQLSRPSEGLVSDYNLTIFLCAAEVRPVAHLIRMLQSRTLHVQAIVAQNPHVQKTVTSEEIRALNDRLDTLEARSVASRDDVRSNGVEHEAPQKLVESTVGREFRKSVQPELEALNRAMRRYEKKLNLLANQTDNKIEYVEYRLNDALALAAVAAKNSKSQPSLVGWLLGKITMVVMLPVQAVGAAILLPLRTISALFRRGEQQRITGRAQRSLRNSKAPLVHSRNGPDRASTRMSRK
ncbi:hypothetical protein NPX13_g7615 [Xylaria arbuscula]|uniref:Uncharacterized protein n=1 Tax=Xylaria arbuscula TaxID=114810 RepID=A0A9W8NAC2_9PEZI|nr:hypothetical protein NPX13_g7615 [Xylaria arbuscula]